MKPDIKQSIYRIVFLFLFFGSATLYGQRTEVGIGAGGVLYWGDLSPKKVTESFSNLRFGAQGLIRSEITPSLSARVNVMFGKLNGDDLTSSDESRRRRNLRFNSTIAEASLLGEFTFLKFDVPNQPEGLSFYLSAGLSVFYFSPTAEYQGITYDLQELGTEGQGMVGFPDNYSKVSFAVPIGGGMKFRLTDQLTLNPEFGLRMAFTDYLDDISGYYVNYFELLNGNGPIAAALGNRIGEYLGQTEPFIVDTGSRRGGPDANDIYFVGMINLTYLLSDSGSIFSRGGKKYNSECPTF